MAKTKIILKINNDSCLITIVSVFHAYRQVKSTSFINNHENVKSLVIKN